MGGTSRAYVEYWAEQRRLAEEADNSKRMSLAKKIVQAVVDRINLEIVRPGPKPEERECYVMAQELRDSSPGLEELVSAILKVEDEET